jgi:hypothetical protein
MNEATEWLQHARGVTRVLGELLHDANNVDCKELALALDGIEAMTHKGLRCARQAHTRMLWEQTPPVSDLLTRG